ncbi:nuclear transport factor 2 family protein [Mycolicibacterium gadium]|uniref:Nuclear transport factor 2 family protein n=1 Tax=Mycolicibacterium gadium TaxID=1794 RepID=A0ABT6GPB4_MYCGU|nr:nuclear transport factor 2 family protein [Mycolicibacterium gadium]MDG5482940.1 nuclear transport factor 2 family protein [Mycolicibacterium gadium]
MELWELSARERIRDSLARYNWSGDAMRLPELAESFCEDGELELRGGAPVQGRAAIVEFLGGAVASPNVVAQESGVRRIVRHNVTNIRFTEMTPQRAGVACYFTVFTEIGLDHYGRYRDLFVPVDDEWLIRHRFVSTDWHAPNSTMAG